MRVHIAVPVRDEVAGLPGLLASLARQMCGTRLDVGVFLLFDGCTDGGLDVARRWLDEAGWRGRAVLVARAATPDAGRARRLAVELALADATDSDRLLTTDADSVPDDDWIEAAVHALETVDVVAGYTRRDDTTLLPARDALERYLEDLHALRRRIDSLPYDPAPSHPWVGGANLGFRVDAYRALGGFAPLTCGEDIDIVNRARHLGLRVRHDRGVRVTTSSRMVGRARGGLADALRFMATEEGEPRVEHPADAARQYARHALARTVFREASGRIDWSAAVRRLGVDADLRRIARDAPNAEAFAMKAVPVPPTTRDVPLSEAAAILCTLKAEQFGA